MLKSIIAKNIYEPLYYKYYRRDNALNHYKLCENYKKIQWNSLKNNKRIQAEKLYKIIKYASENIPYYMKIVKTKKITFSKKTIFEDIKKFPILTKNIMRNEFNNLYKIKPNNKWYYNTSGGSTGEPVKFIQDYDYGAENEAITRLQYSWCKYKVGEPFIKLWGSEKDILKKTDKLKHRFADWIKSITILNAFRMNEEKMREYVRIINKKRPKLILAYAQSITEFTKFIKENNLRVHSPNAIITSANILHPLDKQNIKQIFQCPVYNRYGSREVGNIACECEKQEGLHLNIFTHYIEILNNDLTPCKEGESGDIYITLLTNFTMPLIRYKIGDVATHTKKSCSCKRGMPLIKEVVGRDNDMFITKKGEHIHTGIINMQFYFKEFVNKYQVIQVKQDKIIINLVLSKKSKDYNLKEEFAAIKNNLKKIMGQDCLIDFKIVNNIKPTKSGKHRYTIREF